ncbi:MAG: glucose-6-phosphate isomerase [Candidatus Omnitrophica bacterium]|nr:glucose-6-phosphate isomerase [Candidatus Omnitrophota bacterium]
MQLGIARLQAERALPRLWSRDPSLWSADPTVQASIQQRLGWLEIPNVMISQAESLRRLARDIREAGFTRVLLLGMGGSGLFAEVCRRTVGLAAGHPDLTVLDTTDPTAIRFHQDQGPLRQLLVIAASKSGTTIEMTALSSYFSNAFASAGEPYGAHCLAITDAGTPLETRATTTWRCRRVFVHGAGTGAEVGGRFSALTYFGLVPAALIGMDVVRLLQRAQDMLTRCQPATPLQDNPAVQLGAVLGALAQAGRDKLTLLCASELSSVGTWVEQLIAESTGKMGRGIIPICGEPLRQPASYGSDRLFVAFQLADQPDATVEALVTKLVEAGQPVVSIRWQDVYDLGGEVAKWSMATAIAGVLLGVNPFDQPDVQESKDRTRALLERYTREGRLEDRESPVYADADLAVYGTPGSIAPASLGHCLAAFFQDLHPGDYVALLSFLPRTPALDRAIHALRARVGAGWRAATMAQFGPRYLHSTGQLYKGGPNTGFLVLLTAEECLDLPIPGEPMTFGVLKQAQALGDFQAMQQRGRRILRVHLLTSPERGLQHVMRAVEAASATKAPSRST